MGKRYNYQWILVYVLTAIIGFTSSTHVSAMMGNYVNKDKLPKSVCIVKTYNNLCTGTLIANDIVITAAHCIDKNHIKKPKKKLPIFVSCKQNRSIRAMAMAYPTTDLTQSSSYHTKDQALVLDDDGQANQSLRRKWKYNNSDIAILKLSNPVKKITPQELIVTEEMAVDILTTAIFCGLYGAGQNNRKEVGTVNGIDYKDVKSNLLPDQFLRNSDGHFFTIGKSQGIRPGDSGGPLSCLLADGKWYLLSIHQNLYPKHNWKGRSRATFKDEMWILDTLQDLETIID